MPSNFLEEISVPDSGYSRGSETYTRSGESSQSAQRSYTTQNNRSSMSEYEKRSSLSSGNGGRRRVIVSFAEIANLFVFTSLCCFSSLEHWREKGLKQGMGGNFFDLFGYVKSIY